MKIDYKLKSEVLQNKIVLDAEKQFSYALFKCESEQERETLLNIYLSMCNEDIYFNEARKINRASYYRARLLKYKIFNIIASNKECFFLTLTFKDSTLASTNELTRRRYITRFLANNCSSYIANKDFGAKNGREHYHAIVNGRINPKEWHKLGAINIKRIKSNWSNIYNDLPCDWSKRDISVTLKTSGSKEFLKLAKYISKLTNHSIKETTKRSAIIYSR